MSSKDFFISQNANTLDANNDKSQNITIEINQSYNLQKVRSIIDQIEGQNLDITAQYDDWLKIGFALSSEFHESGRELFHRVSQFYPNYDKDECNNQFDKCLNSQNDGITISTFFYLAKNAGVTSFITNQDGNILLPQFSDIVYRNLPAPLKAISSMFDTPREKDIMLIGSITILSGVFKNIFGMYNRNKIYPNLFLFVLGRAASGKGVLKHCRVLGEAIHQQRLEKSRIMLANYKAQIAGLSKEEKGAIPKPSKQMLFIPADNSAAGFLQLLDENDGIGIIHETEGDTLTQTLKKDFGSYSDVLRKAFHHEPVVSYRKTDQDYIELSNPRLAALLSGTPKQIISLIPDSENGLFSRFMYYYIEGSKEWNVTFGSTGDDSFNDKLKGFSQDILAMFELLNDSKEFVFEFSEIQQTRILDYFAQKRREYLVFQDEKFDPNMVRMGVIHFRICMVLTALRIFETGDDHTLTRVCLDDDFDSAIEIVNVLLEHGSFVLNTLPENKKNASMAHNKELLYKKLPSEFTTAEAYNIAEELGIKVKTAEGYILNFAKNGLTHRVQNGHYKKAS